MGGSGRPRGPEEGRGGGECSKYWGFWTGSKEKAGAAWVWNCAGGGVGPGGDQPLLPLLDAWPWNWAGGSGGVGPGGAVPPRLLLDACQPGPTKGSYAKGDVGGGAALYAGSKVGDAAALGSGCACFETSGKGLGGAGGGYQFGLWVGCGAPDRNA